VEHRINTLCSVLASVDGHKGPLMPLSAVWDPSPASFSDLFTIPDDWDLMVLPSMPRGIQSLFLGDSTVPLRMPRGIGSLFPWDSAAPLRVPRGIKSLIGCVGSRWMQFRKGGTLHGHVEGGKVPGSFARPTSVEECIRGLRPSEGVMELLDGRMWSRRRVELQHSLR